MAQLVKGSDIVAFEPITQTFSLYLEGAMYGLTTSGENIDSIALDEQGGLLISTENSFTVNDGGLLGQDEDILLLPAGSSTWQLYFDGSANGLTDEDISGLWLEGDNLYLAVKDDFAIGNGPAGDNSDLFTCQLSLTCQYDPQLLWNGSAHGPHNNQGTTDPLHDFSVTDSSTPAGCNGLPNCSFEFVAGEQFVDWVEVEEPPFALWRPAGYGHSGDVSAEGVTNQNTGEIAQLISSPIGVSPGLEYRVSYFLRPNGGITIPTVSLHLVGNEGGIESLQPVEWLLTEEWVWIDGGFVCPPAGSGSFQLEFTLAINNSSGSILLDDVLVESRPGDCPLQ